MFEEWFKMMGGLQSILQLGMAAITIANFYTHLSTMAKQLASVIKGMAASIMKFLHKKVGVTIFGKIANP